MGWWERVQRLLDSIESRAALWGLVGGSSVMGAVAGYLSRGVDWINSNLGAFGWWVAALLGALIFALLFALFAWGRERLALASATRKWEKEVDAFNPLEAEFHRIRIDIANLVHPVTRRIHNKKITNCELFGPANIVLASQVVNTKFVECDLVLAREGA